MTTKAQYIESLRDEFNRWETLLAGLSEAQILTTDLDDNWSIKDVMGHLWAWQLRTAARVEAGLHDHEPVFPDWPTDLSPEVSGQPHDLNAWLYQSNKDKTWAQVYGDWQANFQRILEMAGAVPENDLLAKDRFDWLDGYTLAFILQASQEHHAEHYEWLTAHLGMGGDGDE